MATATKGVLGDHARLLSTLGDTDHVVSFEHQTVAVDVDLALAVDPSRALVCQARE